MVKTMFFENLIPLNNLWISYRPGYCLPVSSSAIASVLGGIYTRAPDFEWLFFFLKTSMPFSYLRRLNV